MLDVGKRFVCERCGNSDERYIGRINGRPYCRKCISFSGEEASFEPKEEKTVNLSLSYSLSRQQKELSDRVLSNFIEGKDTLIYAVCGSGKTEISFAVLGYAMSKGLRVGFALPRRDVVIELFLRLKEAFPSNKIVAVYGGHTSALEGDCVILTTHQLFRYPNYFDLLVMDEVDAFPFKGSDVLLSMFKRSVKGHFVMMSATPSKQLVSSFRAPGKEMLTLHTRFHRHPIPVPTLCLGPPLLQQAAIIRKLRQFQKAGKPAFVFVPSIAESEPLYRKTSIFCEKGNFVNSKRGGREKIIADFKAGKLNYLITTAVLERGITVKGLQVLICNADSPIYDAASLIQISGRAGRKKDAPDGEVIFFAKSESKGMLDARLEIQRCNMFLPKLLQADKGK